MAGLVRAINLTRCLMKPLVCGSIWKATITSNCRNYAVVSKETFKNSWEIDTRVVKDVVLYSYENTRFHKLLNIFALSQFVFWIYLAEFSASTLRDAPVEKKDNSDVSDDVPWYRNINLGANKFRNGITFMCLSVGVIILGTSWLYSLKSIAHIVLRKGGHEVTFITHGPFNKKRFLDIPLKNISSTQSRTRATVHLPIKVKGFMGFFMMDMKGEIKNAQLFDATVGLKRIFTR